MWEDPSGLNYETDYQYDVLGNLLRVDQKGSAPTDSTQWRTRLFTYDSLSRLLTANNPESGLITYFYDNNGNLTQKVMPAPNQLGSSTHTLSYCYDALNRVTGKAYSWQACQSGRLPQGTAAVSYSYDEGTNGKGHLTSLNDQAGSATYNYDILGRMASESRVIAGVTKSMSYTYNLDGSIATMTYPSATSGGPPGDVITYTPDAAGRLLSVVDTTNSSQPINYVTGAIYNASGTLTASTFGQTASFTGILNSFSFNSRLQPVNLWSSSPTKTLMNLVYDFHVGNGDNGNVYAITNSRDASRSQAFTYDPLNRLLSAQNAGTDCTLMLPDGHTEYWGNNYVYDAWGNLNQKQITKCQAENLNTAVNANNRLQSYDYDAAGNMTKDNTGTLYSYDAENRISSAAGFTYVYDADGNRVEKINGNTNPATGTLYWYMSTGIVGESDLLGNLQSEYVFFGGERVARKDFPGNAVSYYFSDHLKTASVITNATGSNIKSESDYYPWGGELQFTNGDSNHYKFTGKERDAETGLDYFGARHYSNGLGRFITPDWAAKPAAIPYAVLGDPQTFNLYTYVRNIPTSKVDLDGHQEGFISNLYCGLCNLIIDAFREIRHSPKQAAKDSGSSAKAFVQNTINVLMPIGDNKPSASVKVPPAVVDAPNSAVGHLTTFGLAAVTVALPGPKGAEAGAADAAALANRASEIHGALDPIAQNMRTTAVANVTNADGTVSTLVSSSRNTLAPAQRAVLQGGETAVRGAGHAEETILNSAQQNGQTVNNMGVTRTPCPGCQQRLDQAGVNVSVKKTPD